MSQFYSRPAEVPDCAMMEHPLLSTLFFVVSRGAEDPQTNSIVWTAELFQSVLRTIRNLRLGATDLPPNEAQTIYHSQGDQSLF